MNVATHRVVGMSEFAISDSPDEVLITYSLGSCIGVSVYDPVARVGGLLHAMMPLSSADLERARIKPATYMDSGLAALLEGVFARGATKRNLLVKVAGAASSMDSAQEMFRIGERNYTVLRRMLWKNALFIRAEDVGGAGSRTMLLDMATGRTALRILGRETELR